MAFRVVPTWRRAYCWVCQKVNRPIYLGRAFRAIRDIVPLARLGWPPKARNLARVADVPARRRGAGAPAALARSARKPLSRHRAVASGIQKLAAEEREVPQRRKGLSRKRRLSYGGPRVRIPFPPPLSPSPDTAAAFPSPFAECFSSTQIS